jgi:K+-transporting ATPase A subunit
MEIVRIPRDRAASGAASGLVTVAEGIHPQPGLHGLSEVTYAFVSVANNNGSRREAGAAADTTDRSDK